MIVAAFIIAALSIAISATSITLAIRRNHDMGLDWRFRPLP